MSGYKDIKYAASVWGCCCSLALKALFNCLPDRQIDRQTERETDRQPVSWTDEVPEMRQVNADWPTVTGVGAGELKPKLLGACALRLRASCISCKLTTSSPRPLSTDFPLSSLHFVPFHYKHLKTFILFEDFHFQSVEMSHSRMGAPRLRSIHCSIDTFPAHFERFVEHSIMKSDCRTFLIFISFSFHFISLDSTRLNCAKCQVVVGTSLGSHLSLFISSPSLSPSSSSSCFEFEHVLCSPSTSAVPLIMIDIDIFRLCLRVTLRQVCPL